MSWNGSRLPALFPPFFLDLDNEIKIQMHGHRHRHIHVQVQFHFSVSALTLRDTEMCESVARVEEIRTNIIIP